MLQEQEVDVADPRMKYFGPVGRTEEVFLPQVCVPGPQLGV